MAPIRREKGRGPQPLRRRCQRSVHESERRVSIYRHELRRSNDVIGLEGFDRKFARRSCFDKCQFRRRPDPLAEQISDLGEDHDRDEHLLAGTLPPGQDPCVPRVVAIEEGVDRACIGEDGQSWGSRQSSSSARSAVSLCPLANRPAMLGSLGFGRPPAR